MMNRWQNTIGILLATTSSHLALRTSGWNGRCLDHRSSQLSASVLALKNAKTTIRNMNAQAMEKDKDEDAFDENPDLAGVYGTWMLSVDILPMS